MRKELTWSLGLINSTYCSQAWRVETEMSSKFDHDRLIVALSALYHCVRCRYQFHHRNQWRFLDWQRECLARASSRNLLICLPTSGGKTLVAELLMLRAIAAGQDALLVLPYVAIVQEKVPQLLPTSIQINRVRISDRFPGPPRLGAGLPC